jgi:TonB-dependent receptor
MACLMPTQAQDAEEAAPPVIEEVEDDVSVQQTIVVRGQFIPDEKRSTSEVSSLIDAADFALQGDSDAAGALARVAGIATADDQFIYVRGLNERYSSALLNGSPLPSPSPLRRVAPLDLFPTSALSAVLVQKTYSPNLPGEFGGGVVDLRTKAVPDERFLTLSASAGFNSETSLRDGLLYNGGDTDFLGIDDGTRDRPSIANGLTPEFGQQLTDNSSLLVMQQGELGPNGSFGVTAGERIDYSNDLSIGLLGALSYSNNWSTKRGRRGYAFNQTEGLGVFFDQGLFSTENNVKLNGLATLGFEIFDNHEIQFVGLMTRSTDKEARTVSGFNAEDVNVRRDALEWFERQLWSTQAKGEHNFPGLMDLQMNWRGSYSEALRDAPYQLSNTYIIGDDGVPRLGTSASANRFQFSRVDDDTTDFGIDFELPLISGNGDCSFLCEIDLKAGYAYVENDRSATSIIYDVNGVGATDGEQRLDFLYSSIFASGQGSVVEIAGEQFPQLYVATLETDAAYVGLDAQLTSFLRASVGVRYEDSIQAVDTQVIGQDLTNNLVEGVIEEQDYLPALTITWNPIDDFQLRAGYSETLTRPQFRELAPAVFVNSETDANFFGNPFLVNAAIKNYDLRGEYYFARDQFMTIGLFYKDLTNPIEEILVPAETLQTTFINAPSAELYGIEVEYEQILPVQDWFEWDFMNNRDLQVKTNYTWSDSEVSATGDVAFNIGTNLNPVRSTVRGEGRIEDGRRLQGQSEHLFNLQVGLLNDFARSDINVLVNFVSERIRSGEVTARNLPAILEKPPTTVDVVWNKGFDFRGGDYEFSLNIENLFAQGYEAYQERGNDRVDVDVYDQGRIITFGLKRTF